MLFTRLLFGQHSLRFLPDQLLKTQSWFCIPGFNFAQAGEDLKLPLQVTLGFGLDFVRLQSDNLSTESASLPFKAVSSHVLVEFLLLRKTINLKALVEAPLPLLAPPPAKFNGQVLIYLISQELSSVSFNVV